MRTWEATVKAAVWTCPNDVKQTYRDADWANSLWIFDINGYRIIAHVKYQLILAPDKVVEGIVYIKNVFTHGEYDVWSAMMRKGKGKK